jgi:hypothetical protein
VSARRQIVFLDLTARKKAGAGITAGIIIMTGMF